MALTKKVYVDNQTVIPAANLNAIQDEVIANANAIGGKAPVQHTHTKSQITDFPSSLPASDVSAWAKASTKPTYTASEVGAAPTSHTHTKSQITDLVEYILPKATKTTLGGVKVGDGLSITTDGTLSANAVSGEPDEYLKSASISGNELTLVKKDNTTITFIPTAGGGGSAERVDWANVYNKPDTFPPSAHTHSQYLTEQSLKTVNGESLVGTGDITISGEPTEYLKGAAISGNTLTLTKKDNSTVVFTPTTGGGDSALTNKLDKDGDGSNVTAAFTADSTRANIATGEKLSVLFGKIAKWLADLGSLAFKSTVAKSDLANDVQTSLSKADSALQSYTETDPTVPEWAKAETKPGYSKSEVGLGNVDNVKQYSASNPPPYPVTSVNGKTGAVTVNVPTVPSTTNILKGNGSGGLVAATRGSDYIASGNIVKQTLVASETTPTEDYAINWVYG